MSKQTVAKSRQKAPSRAEILGLAVDSSSTSSLLSIVEQIWERKSFTKPFFIVTAYSEFFLEAGKNPQFKAALARADMVVADGIVVPAALDYKKNATGNPLTDLVKGFAVGRKIWEGKYRDQVIRGVELTEKLIEEAGIKGKRVFLLGGRNGVAGRLADRYLTIQPNLKISSDGGPEIDSHGRENFNSNQNDKLIVKINKFQPDVLLAALGRFKQEMWIAKNLPVLKAKVVIGVGSSFDELAGEGAWGRKIPDWVDKRGLKWLWRVWGNPGHLQRVWRAFPVLAWKIYRGKKMR